MITKLLKFRPTGNLHLYRVFQNFLRPVSFNAKPRSRSGPMVTHPIFNSQFSNRSSQVNIICVEHQATVAINQTLSRLENRTGYNSDIYFRTFAPMPPFGSTHGSTTVRCKSSILFVNNKQNGTYQLLKAFHKRSFSTSSDVDSPNKDSDRACWRCGRNTNPRKELFFCKCGIVQEPVEGLSYFELMQIDTSFDLDLRSLGTSFRDTQKKLHPDMFSSKSQEELLLAEKQSSLLNKAYHTLLRPLSRAIYMLEMNGITFDEKDTISDPEFLMDIMSINERIQDAVSDNDLKCLQAENNDIVCKCIQEISVAFQKQEINEAKRATIKLRYYTTIQERIAELQRNKLG